ncbi:hypothetical protein F0919_05465 [Taibaiella lutea]|uniref:Uncharacterized protein n=1 Tax=Taibaiella lutea TaxID=2608001 RepID=A0A5M6CRU9_9BACT|nr:hypothetical protein [Taibaiella lutea]KAA5537120.1 hypothetical protein F0919_05465 [Taibaiella lutea]
MKRYCTIISLALFAGLFIYLFYRTQHTVVNIMLDKLSYGNALAAILYIRKHFLLPEFVIYNLPEALWVFAATLVSKHLFIKLGRKNIHLAWTPLCYAVLLEFLQLLHWMPGSFDWLDILPSFAFTLCAVYFIKCPLQTQQLLGKFNYRTFFFIYIYAIVFLSHVSI